MARILVIGGTLFVGRALVERLLARGDDVVVMHRGRGTPFGDRVAELHGDRNDADGVRRLLDGERFDAVFDNVYDWRRGTTGTQVAAAAGAAFARLGRYAELLNDADLIPTLPEPTEQYAPMRRSNPASLRSTTAKQ